MTITRKDLTKVIRERAYVSAQKVGIACVRDRIEKEKAGPASFVVHSKNAC